MGDSLSLKIPARLRGSLNAGRTRSPNDPGEIVVEGSGAGNESREERNLEIVLEVIKNAGIEKMLVILPDRYICKEIQ